jgi:hypothetical protein
MGKTFGAGLLFIAAAIVTIVVASALNLEIDSVFFGLAIGGVLAFVSDRSAVGWRIGAFVVGLIVTMAGYLIRILALNESLIGQILFAVIVGILIMAICGLSSGRLPLWSGLLGAAFVIGAYESNFLAAPQDITTNLFTNVSMALVPMAIAFLFGIFIKPDSFNHEHPQDAPVVGTEDGIAAQSQNKSEV